MFEQMLESIGIDANSVNSGLKVFADLEKRFTALETKVNAIHQFILGCQADLAERDKSITILDAQIIDELPQTAHDETAAADPADETAPAPVTETEAFRMYELIGQIDALHAQHARPHQSVYDEANALIDRYQDEELIRYGY